MENKTTKVTVRFTQQQIQLLDSLKKEGKFGEAYSDIVLNVLREYIKYTSMFPEYLEQKFGRGGI